MLVYDGKTVRARLVPQPDCRILAITFTFWQFEQSLDSIGFAEELLEEYAIPAVHITAASNHWYQTEEMDDLLEAVARVGADYDRVVTYGSSMGGYAAMLFSGPLRADAAIGISPLFSINGKVSGDTRWFADAQGLTFRHDDMASSANREADAFVLFDPLTPDRGHALRIAACFNHPTLIPLPMGAHPCDVLMVDMRLLKKLILALIANEPVDLRALRRLMRSRRHQSVYYWQNLSEAAAARGRVRLAEFAKERAAELGQAVAPSLEWD